MRVGRHLTPLVALVAAAALLALPALLSGCGSPGGASPSPSPSLAPVSEQQVIDMVDMTAAAMEKDVAGTIAAINAGEAPFVDAEHPDLYAFAYDTAVRMVANPDPTDVGRIMTDVPDITGKLFRAEIVEGAVANGSGWVEYVHEHHALGGMYHKSAYYRLITGSDGIKYVVCAARYVKPYASPLPSSSAAAADSPTKAEVQAFVKEAVAYARQVGREEALETFTAKGGEFHQGQLYIYAYDFTGTVIGHGGDAGLVGKNLIDMTDPNGVRVIQELRSLAEQGAGWLYYTWPNPANGNRQEAKLGYVERVDDGWFLGSGAYGPAAVAPPSRAEVVSFVDEALAYARQRGRQEALAAFMDTSGRFVRGELYVFAYDMKGNVLSLPYEPEKVGQGRWDLRDANGDYFIRDIVETARDEGAGWVGYVYVNPAQGNEPQQKLSYVRKVDDTWLIGAGTYQPPAS